MISFRHLAALALCGFLAAPGGGQATTLNPDSGFGYLGVVVDNLPIERGDGSGGSDMAVLPGGDLLLALNGNNITRVNPRDGMFQKFNNLIGGYMGAITHADGQVQIANALEQIRIFDADDLEFGDDPSPTPLSLDTAWPSEAILGFARIAPSTPVTGAFGGMMFIAGACCGNVLIRDPSDGSRVDMISFPTAPSFPTSFAFDADGTILLTSVNGTIISRADPLTGTLIDSIDTSLLAGDTPISNKNATLVRNAATGDFALMQMDGRLYHLNAALTEATLIASDIVLNNTTSAFVAMDFSADGDTLYVYDRGDAQLQAFNGFGTGEVPTPATLALLAVGALLIRLRNH